MKFLNALDTQEIMTIIDVLSMSMLYYNDIRIAHIDKDPAIITTLAQSLVTLAKHNVVITDVRDIAIMEIAPEDLVKKVERNGRVLGVIQGGRK